MKMKNKRSLLMGSYSIGIAAIAVAVVIALNVFIGQLPTTLTKPDTTPEKLATVGADSKKLLEAVDTEITIYRVYSDTYTYTTENNTQETIPLDVNIVNLLDKYADACSYITLKVIDPVSNPGFLEKYRDEGLTQNSLVFETEKRSVCLSPVDLLRYELDGLPGNYLTYEQCYDYLMSSYYSTGSVPSYSEYFFAENEITGAIDYVTSDSIPVIYTLTGHGETPFDTSFADIIVDENAVQKELSLVTGDTVAVPEDAAAILIYAPYADITEAERDALISYLDGGGNIIYFSYRQFRDKVDMPNFDALCAHMGLAPVEGAIAETQRYAKDPIQIVPLPTGEGISAALSANAGLYTYTLETHAIKPVEGAEGVTLYPLLETTKDAYFYTEENVKDPSKAEKQTFTVAYQAHVTNSEGNEGGALYWFATPFLVMDDYYTVGNGILFRELITNVGDKDVSVSIIGKLMGQTYLQITEQDRTLWTAIIVGVIPAAVLIAGIAVCVIRRRR